MSPYTVQHDPRYFAEPETFDPWRWTPDSQAQRPKFTFFPFGGGPRVCIGEPFAMQEAMLIVATLAQQWRMRLAPGSVVAMEPRVTLRPKNGLPLTLVRRNKAKKIYHLNKE
jgi:cytochrome P450